MTLPCQEAGHRSPESPPADRCPQQSGCPRSTIQTGTVFAALLESLNHQATTVLLDAAMRDLGRCGGCGTTQLALLSLLRSRADDRGDRTRPLLWALLIVSLCNLLALFALLLILALR